MNLTAHQKQAVYSTAKETLVIAGAGSGKTACLIARIVHLIRDRGVSPYNIMALTFTRRAAGELIGRLRAALGDQANEALSSMFCSTFHGVALQILKADGGAIGWDEPHLTIIDEDDAETLMMQCARELGLVRDDKWLRGFTAKQARAWLEFFYTGRKPQDSRLDDDLQTLFMRYWQTCQQMNVMDFGMILRETRRLLAIPAVLARYTERITHALVDEGQDSNEVDFVLHDYFSPPAELFMVFDPRQTIYTWRGSRPDLCFSKHPNATIINLTESFRFGPAIAEPANRLIAHNSEPNTEPMVGMQEGGKVDVRHGRSVDVAEAVAELRNHGYAFRDIAVLARNHRTLKRLEAVFRESNIPTHRVKTRSDYTEDEGVRAALLTMRVLVNPNDKVASMVAQRHGDYAMMTCTPDFPPSPELPVSSVIPKGGATPAWKYLVAGPLRGKSIAEAVRWFGLHDAQDDMPDEDVVTLCTVHAAKGLEYPCVILVGLNEGDWPSKMSMREDPDCKEERRAFYVGVTRAKERLVLFYREPEDQSDARAVSEPSRFLKESGLYGKTEESQV